MSTHRLIFEAHRLRAASAVELGAEVIELLEVARQYLLRGNLEPLELDGLRAIHAALDRVDLDTAERTVREYLSRDDPALLDPRERARWVRGVSTYVTRNERLQDRLSAATASPEDDGWRFVRNFPGGWGYGLPRDTILARAREAAIEIETERSQDRRAEGACRLHEALAALIGPERMRDYGPHASRFSPVLSPLVDMLAATPALGRAERTLALLRLGCGALFTDLARRWLECAPREASQILLTSGDFASFFDDKLGARIAFKLAARVPDIATMMSYATDTEEDHLSIASALESTGERARAITYLEAREPSSERDAALRRMLADAGRGEEALAYFVVRPEDVATLAHRLGLPEQTVIAAGRRRSDDPAAWKRYDAQTGVSPDALLKGHFEPRDFLATLRSNPSADPKWVIKLCTRAIDLVFDARSTWGPNDDPRAVLRSIFEAAHTADAVKREANRAKLRKRLEKHASKTPSYHLREAAFDVLESQE
jgi:hypothetical protein